MPHLSQSLKKILGSICFSFFSALLLVLLSLKLHSLKSAQYFTFPLSLHGKSACGVESPSTGSGCPPQLCNHVVCMERFTLHRAAVSLAWECDEKRNCIFASVLGRGQGEQNVLLCSEEILLICLPTDMLNSEKMLISSCKNIFK